MIFLNEFLLFNNDVSIAFPLSHLPADFTAQNTSH